MCRLQVQESDCGEVEENNFENVDRISVMTELGKIEQITSSDRTAIHFLMWIASLIRVAILFGSHRDPHFSEP